MISTKKNPVKNHDNKHYFDLNESVYESASNAYLRAMFKIIAGEHTKLKKWQIEKISESMRSKSLDQAVKIADKHVGDYVVFYYGVGDTDPTEKELKLEKPVSIKKKPARKKATKSSTKTTQETLENNMKKHTTKKGKKGSNA